MSKEADCSRYSYNSHSCLAETSFREQYHAATGCPFGARSDAAERFSPVCSHKITGGRKVHHCLEICHRVPGMSQLLYLYVHSVNVATCGLDLDMYVHSAGWVATGLPGCGGFQIAFRPVLLLCSCETGIQAMVRQAEKPCI